MTDLLSSNLLPFVLFFSGLVFFFYWGSRKPKGFPPGPRWWPILGSALEVARLRKETGFLYQVCKTLSEKYSCPLVGIKIGCDRIVVINDYEAMKAMLTSDDCAGRPIGPMFKSRTFGKRLGVLTADGRLWAVQRRFVIRHLRDFGYGTTGMTRLIEEETARLIEFYRRKVCKKENVNEEEECKESVFKNEKSTGQIYQLSDDNDKRNEKNIQKKFLTYEDFYIKADFDLGETAMAPSMIVDMQEFFGIPALNTLWRMMAGKRYDFDKKELLHLQKILTALLKDLDMIGCMFHHFPILQYIMPNMSGYNAFMSTHRQVWEFLNVELQNHKRTFNPNDIRDFMDLYIKELQSEHDNTFSEEQLLAICVDLFIAGSETTYKALTFGFLHLVLDQEVQKKAQKEIDTIIGFDRKPGLSDRPKLTYVNAIVLESLRMFMARTLNVPHRSTKDTTLIGYQIPKNTMLVVNFNAVMMGNFWEDVEAFRPERFIDSEGKISIPDQYLPFSFGKHRCMGEVLAKSNMFVMIAALLQSFTFTPVPGEEPKLEYIDGVTPSPKEFKAVMTLRTPYRT